MTDTSKTKEKQIENSSLKNAILNICEPMCLKISKEKPENIVDYMMKYLKNNYNYSSSLLHADQEKELSQLKKEIQFFHEQEENLYYMEVYHKLGKNIKSDKKSKNIQKQKQRLAPDEIIPSDDEAYNLPEEIDTRLDDIQFIKENANQEMRPDYFEVNTGSNIFFLKAENKELREKWVKALTKAKLEGEKSIREILKKNIKNEKNENEYKDMIIPELNYDAELEQLFSAITRLKLDNQNLMNFLDSKNLKDPELKILKDRFNDDFEILQTCIKLFDPIEGKGIKDINKIKKITRNSSYEDLNINNNMDINNAKLNNAPRQSFNKNPNREEDDYSIVKDNSTNEPLIISGEEFYEMEEDIDNNIDNDYLTDNNINNNNINIIKKETDYNNNNIIKNNNYNNYNYNTNESINMNSNNLINYNNSNNNNNNNLGQLTKLTKSNIGNKKNKFYDPLYDYPKRTSLPSKKLDMGFNIWKVFKSAVGKDLSHFGVPVFFNEPISSLQKFCEPFQYAHLLNSAAKEPNPYIRLAKSACFCIGQFVINNGRQAKFFNPLLYETFEYVDNAQNFRYMSEQVSHHPAISAYYAEGDGWNIYANTNAKIKFIITGRLEVDALGRKKILIIPQ